MGLRGFKPTKQMCPACLDRGHLDMLGRPRRKDGVSLTFSCEFCNGTGRADPWPDYKYHPPKVKWLGDQS